MNEDNQYPNQNDRPDQTPNGNSNDTTNHGQFGHPNQNAGSNSNQYANQGGFGNQNQHPHQGQFNNSNQNQFGNSNQDPVLPPKQKKPKSKTIPVTIVSIAFALLLVAGGAFAFFNMQKSTKDKMLLAEINSWAQVNKAFESRYQPELEWAKKTETTPSEYDYEISASVDGDFYSYEEMMFAEIVNGSTINLGIQMDPNNQLMKMDVGADVQGVTIDDISGYITPQAFMLAFPFTDDVLQVKDEDFGNFMRSMDPSYVGSENLGLSDWMGKNSFLSEENKKYLLTEYLLYLYNSIPDESFTESQEQINVFGQSLNTDKITMEINDEQFIDILLGVLEKAKNDPKFKEIVIETLENITGAVGTLEEDYDFDLEEGIDELIAELKDIETQDNKLQYTVWISSDAVVQSKLDLGDFVMEGSRLFAENTQQWDYSFGDGEVEYFNFTGDLSYENGKINDVISFFDDYERFEYVSEETVNGGERQFDRTVNYQDEYEEGFELFWNGETNYQGDSVTGEHRLGVSSYDFNIEFSMDETASLIKNVEIPTDNIVDIGAMSSGEIEDYIMNEFMQDAQGWFMSLYFELGIF
ncbi:hypothetical protein CD30_03135 [Ureibacillus massiliensis 4400831 = CIP 108448 = CCUG 49529]|uniref:Uncharacterized protein n=2 Tax=cellular organisms TaxID=131567 RepID=A0A0A3J824_9BACL|nr:DUF6583 family protein [Ureibacillus massiliensis]KGR91910.1 hypothetical protein CD30_03135 [Ureibacillus massiliensis 4400831 = CIP 108448 = CCUG 49529]